MENIKAKVEKTVEKAVAAVKEVVAPAPTTTTEPSPAAPKPLLTPDGKKPTRIISIGRKGEPPEQKAE